jgi:uncharacterized protein (TIGR02145 family)
MKYHYLIAALALFIVACGEVGGETIDPNPPGPGISSSSSGTQIGGGSSSSNGNAACQGANCCKGASFEPATNFCVDEQLYTLCGGKKYDPYKEGCFKNELYQRCDIEAARGVCVHNSLLRCRQEGNGETYIRDPLLGMKCEANGSITGTIKDLDNNNREYKIVQIGWQIWLAENLKTEPAPGMNSKCYNNNPANCDTYGRLYDWATAMKLPLECNWTNENCPPSHPGLWKGLCPQGFAFPRDEDWRILANYAGGDSIAGNRLKSTSGWSNNSNGTDSYGFNALPGGYYNELMGGFGIDDPRVGDRSMWWSTTQEPIEAHYWTIISADTEFRGEHFLPKALYMGYVRCLHY